MNKRYALWALVLLVLPIVHAQGTCSVDGAQVLRIVPPPDYGSEITTDHFYLYYEINGAWLKAMLDAGHTVQITTTHLSDLEGDRCVGGNLDSADVDPQVIRYTGATQVPNPYGTFIKRVWYQHVELYNQSTGCHTSGEHLFTIYILVDGTTKCTTQYQFVAHSPTVKADVTWTNPIPDKIYKFPSPSNDATIPLDVTINVTQGGSGKICVIWQKDDGGSWRDMSLQGSFYAQAGQYPISVSKSLRSITPDWEGEWRVAVYYTPTTNCSDSRRVLLSADAFTATVDYSTYTPPPSTCGSYTWTSPTHGEEYVEGGTVPINISIPGDEFDYLGEIRYAYRLEIEQNVSGSWQNIQTINIEKQYSWQSTVNYANSIELPVGEYRIRLSKYVISSGESTSCEVRYFSVVHIEDINYTWIHPQQLGNYEFNEDQNTYFPFVISGSYNLSSGSLCWRYQEVEDTTWTIYPESYSGSGSFSIDTNIPAAPGQYTMQFYTSSDGCNTVSNIIEERTFTITVVTPPPPPPPPPEENVPEENVTTGGEVPLPPPDQGESQITGYAVYNTNTFWYLIGLFGSGFLATVDVPAALATFAVWNYAGIRSQMLDSSAFWEAVALPAVLSIIIIARRLNNQLGW